MREVANASDTQSMDRAVRRIKAHILLGGTGLGKIHEPTEKQIERVANAGMASSSILGNVTTGSMYDMFGRLNSMQNAARAAGDGKFYWCDAMNPSTNCPYECKNGLETSNCPYDSKLDDAEPSDNMLCRRGCSPDGLFRCQKTWYW